MAASVFVGARTVCISISQAGADLKQLQGREFHRDLSSISEESNSSLPRRIQNQLMTETMNALHRGGTNRENLCRVGIR